MAGAAGLDRRIGRSDRADTAPYGDTGPPRSRRLFERQIGALAEAGADLIIVETMIDLAEARLAVAAAKRLAPAHPGRGHYDLRRHPARVLHDHGDDHRRGRGRAGRAGADLVGSNCGNGIEAMVAIGLEFSRSTRLPIAIQSNAGLPQLVAARCAGRRRRSTSRSTLDR